VRVDGTREEVADETRRVQDVLQESGAVQMQVSRDEKERLLFWAGRKAAFPARDGSRPTTTAWTARYRASAWARCCADLGARAQVRLSCANVFHAGDGNLHPIILYDSNKPDELARTEEFGGEILELCLQVGGTSPASTGSASRRSTRCASSSARPSSRLSAPSRRFRRARAPQSRQDGARPCIAARSSGRMHVHAGQQRVSGACRDSELSMGVFLKIVLVGYLVLLAVYAGLRLAVTRGNRGAETASLRFHLLLCFSRAGDVVTVVFR
jgi:glycolate oxidase